MELNQERDRVRGSYLLQQNICPYRESRSEGEGKLAHGRLSECHGSGSIKQFRFTRRRVLRA